MKKKVATEIGTIQSLTRFIKGVFLLSFTGKIKEGKKKHTEKSIHKESEIHCEQLHMVQFLPVKEEKASQVLIA